MPAPKNPKKCKLWKENLRKANLGKKQTQETIEKRRTALKGKIPWNKGLTKENSEGLRKLSEKHKGRIPAMKGKHHSEESKEKIRRAKKGKPSGRKGILLSEEYKEKLKKSWTEERRKKTRKTWNKKKEENSEEYQAYLRQLSERTKGKKNALGTHHKGHEPWNKGLTKEDDERIKKLSKDRKGQNNPAWIDGNGYKPYIPEFNNELKELIRHRDNYTCQLCSISEIGHQKKLSIHHIDYNKENCNPLNLISLCRICNSQVNSNRDEWFECFDRKVQEVMNSKDYNCTFPIKK